MTFGRTSRVAWRQKGHCRSANSRTRTGAFALPRLTPSWGMPFSRSVDVFAPASEADADEAEPLAAVVAPPPPELETATSATTTTAATASTAPRRVNRRRRGGGAGRARARPEGARGG